MLSKQEVYRQVFHIIVGIVIVLLLYYEILSSLALFLLIIVSIILSFLSKRIRLPVIGFFIEVMERDDDKRDFPGKGFIFFFVGTLLAVKLFPKNIALASIMVLALGDSISHLVGQEIGRIKNIFNRDGKKLLEGTLFGTLAGFFGALIFVPLPEAFLGSAAAMIAEVIKIDFNDHTLDDNMVVPLVAGTMMLLVKKYLGF